MEAWFSASNQPFSSSSPNSSRKELLNQQEIGKVLNDVKADDVAVIPVDKQCDWAYFMVVATARSTWHVKNIAQALIYQAGFLFPKISDSLTSFCLQRMCRKENITSF
ncbi:hypothetical protein SLA2020_049460 [Shorea laevis]